MFTKQTDRIGETKTAQNSPFYRRCVLKARVHVCLVIKLQNVGRMSAARLWDRAWKTRIFHLFCICSISAKPPVRSEVGLMICERAKSFWLKKETKSKKKSSEKKSTEREREKEKETKWELLYMELHNWFWCATKLHVFELKETNKYGFFSLCVQLHTYMAMYDLSRSLPVRCERNESAHTISKMVNKEKLQRLQTEINQPIELRSVCTRLIYHLSSPTPRLRHSRSHFWPIFMQIVDSISIWLGLHSRNRSSNHFSADRKNCTVLQRNDNLNNNCRLVRNLCAQWISLANWRFPLNFCEVQIDDNNWWFGGIFVVLRVNRLSRLESAFFRCEIIAVSSI